VRTAIGVGALTFYVVLFIAGSQDIGAQRFATAIPTITLVLRWMLAVLPPVAAIVAWKLCRDFSRSEDLEEEKERIRHHLEGGDGEPPPPRPPSRPEKPKRKPATFALAAIVAAVFRLVGRRKKTRV
jgi:ubiquinol-cytochrome c reductase cytochrome b subunit